MFQDFATKAIYSAVLFYDMGEFRQALQDDTVLTSLQEKRVV